MSSPSKSHADWAGPVVYYDGDCGFCSRVVIFVAERDPHARLRFASLQSDAGREVLRSAGRGDDEFDTVVLVDGDTVHVKSTAALEIAKRLRFPWPLARVFLLVPRPLRDRVYDVVARNRHRILGGDRCVLPSSLDGRILDGS